MADNDKIDISPSDIDDVGALSDAELQALLGGTFDLPEDGEGIDISDAEQEPEYDIFEDIPIDQLEEFNRHLGNLSSTVESAGSGLLDDLLNTESDIDNELKMLLMQDAAAEEKFNEEESELESILSPKPLSVVIGTNEDGTPIMEQHVSENKAVIKRRTTIATVGSDVVNRIPRNVYVISIGVLGVVIIAVAAFLMIAYGTIGENAELIMIGDAIPVTLANDTINYANYTYVSDTKTISGVDISITKFIVDSQATVFYFAHEPDWEQYNLLLTDDLGNIYNLDNTHINPAGGKEKKTVVRFSPLNDDAKSMTLRVVNLTTNEGAEFSYYFVGGLIKPASAYYGPELITLDNGGVIRLEQAIFTSAGSTIILSHKNDDSNKISIDTGNGGVSLKERAKSLLSTNEDVKIYDFGDRTVYHLDYTPVIDFSRSVNLILDNVFVVSKQSLKFPPTDIFVSAATAAETPKKIILSDATVVLERMGIMGKKFVMVSHAETEQGRIFMNIDTTLSVSLENGQRISVKGENNAIAEGCDVIFDMSDYWDELQGIPISNYEVAIDSISLKAPRTTFGIDLEETRPERGVERSMAEDSILQAFGKRLSYKSGNISFYEIIGFSQELMNNETLMKQYAPDTELTDCDYSIQVKTLVKEGERMYAIVSEVWRGRDDTREVQFLREHKITGILGEDNWIIVSDELIN